ncbi:MAG: xanthine phosphoribosyltransferase [Clostridia bacterium]|nr:xanthine phosphoribosyltransferase [Clostridia bacterium]
MELLKERIRQDGVVKAGNVLKVDSFLNHQVDCSLMSEIGKEFARLFKDKGVTKVVTIESSGIAPAAMTALEMGVPMIILKKATSAILSDGVIQTEVFSFTKRTSYQLTLKGKFIVPGDKVLLIDDFLAKGEAALGGANIIKRAGGEVVGIGAVISKNFQPGMKRLRDAGYHVESLAQVSRMDENVVEFEDDDE